MAATGCRLLFVQTHADLDEDIRDDWRRHLAAHYEVPEVFFVDSLRGLKEQLANGRTGRRPRTLAGSADDATLGGSADARPTGQPGRSAACRAGPLPGPSRANTMPTLEQLEAALEEQHEKLVRSMADHLDRELRHSSSLWERRLLSAVTQVWGFSPFSSLLRFYNAIGGLIASLTLFRARSSAQIALVGAVQGFRWLRASQEEQATESRLQQLASTSADDSLLREAQLLVCRLRQIGPLRSGPRSRREPRHAARRGDGT